MKSLLVTALLVASGAHAQWKAEPSAVFGITLGAALDTTHPDRCVSGPERPCIEDRPGVFDSTRTRIYYLPFEDFKPDAFVEFAERKVVAVEVTVERAEYPKLKALLIERYGRPTRSKTEIASNKLGGDWPVEALDWSGKKVSLYAYQGVNLTDPAVARFYLNSYAADQVRLREEAVKRNASKF